MLLKKASYIFYCLFFVVPFFVYGQGDTKIISPGSYIIDMGVEPQTIGNGLKPYGLVYDLVSNQKIPVIWSIKSDKVLGEADFTYDDTEYKGGPFIIEAKYLTNSIRDIITTWENGGNGVVGEYTTSEVTVPVYDYIVTVPQIMIYGGNSAIAIQYFNNAGINFPDRIEGLPTTLSTTDACRDLYVITDADITDGDQAGLFDFITSRSGNVFVQGKSASILESLTDPSGADFNLLTVSGLRCYSAGICGFSQDHPADHTGSPQYNSSLGNESLNQFIGNNLDLATDNNSSPLVETETWYLPNNQWDNTVNLAISTLDDSYTVNDIGAKVVFGRARDRTDFGRIMYVGGNDLNSGTAGDVAAQRLLLNMIMQTGIDHTGTVQDIMGPSKIIEGSPSDFTATFAGVTPSAYTWRVISQEDTLTQNTSDFTFQPTVSNNRYEAEISIVASDDCGHSAYANKAITVYPINAAPVATDDEALAIGSQQLTIDVLANDSDPQPDDQLSISLVGGKGPVYGSASISGNKIVYTGNNDTYILDSLYYAACDDGLDSMCSQALLVITNELMINSAPVVENQSFTVTAGELSEICLAATDNENDELEITALSSAGTGTLDNASSGDLCFNYTVAEDFVGTEEVTVTVCDIRENFLCTDATITITVEAPNKPPVFADQAFEVFSGVPNTLCVEAVDGDDDQVVLSSVGSTESGATLSNGDTRDLCFEYTATEDFSGQDRLVMEVCDLDGDNPLCTQATVTINVTLTNKPPVVADQTFEALSGDVKTFCVEAADQPGDELVLTSISNAASGAVIDMGAGDLCFDYQSPIDFSGPDTFTVEICDLNEDNPLCTSATITVNVALSNKAPVVTEQTFTASSGNKTTYCVEATDFDGDEMVMSIISSDPQATITVDGLCLDYLPSPTFSGQEEIKVEICDMHPQIPLCTTSVLTVTVDTPPITISKAVTPDGNRQNDVFFIENIASYPDNSVRIYDRWGGLVFETNGYNNDSNNWDGLNGSKETPAGTYFYSIALPSSGKKYKGYVELIK